MKKTIFYSIFVAAALLLFGCVPLEARAHHRHHHRHHSTHVQVGIGSGLVARETYVARKYVRPVTVVQPVYVLPTYPAPAYVYTAPAAPVYVEEVHVAEPVCRPFTFGGLSFSWNFFR